MLILRWRSTLLAAIALIGVSAAALWVCGPGIRQAIAEEQTWTLAPADEAAFVANINAARSAQGLGSLTVDTNMRAAARDWTIWMAENSTLQHAGDIVTGAPSGWTKVGENVGRGGAVASVWGAFMASPGHAANVLDPSYTRVAVGMVWTSEGVLYTTHRFAAVPSDKAPEPTPSPTPTPTPTSAPTTTPPPTSTPSPTPTAATPTATESPVTGPTPTAAAPTATTEPTPATIDENEPPTAERLRATMMILLAADSG